MAKPIGVVNPVTNPNTSGGGGINPAVLKFVVALVIATAAISALEQTSRGAAVMLAFVVVLLLFIKNPILGGYLNMGSSALSKGIS